MLFRSDEKIQDIVKLEEQKLISNEEIKENDRELEKVTRQQLVLVFLFGLMALLLLMSARNFNILTKHSVATVSVLRDIVAGCVGFLVGAQGTCDK